MNKLVSIDYELTRNAAYERIERIERLIEYTATCACLKLDNRRSDLCWDLHTLIWDLDDRKASIEE